MNPTDQSAAPARSGLSTRAWLVLAAAVIELLVIAAGCNQWVTDKAFGYSGDFPQNGFAKQFVYSTQTFAWRVPKATHQSTSQWIASFASIATLLVVTGLLVAFLVRRGSFWRAALTSLLITVFATQAAVVVAGLIYDGPHYLGFSGFYTPLSDNGYLGQGQSGVSITFSGGGRATRALFDSPSGYRFVAGLLLGVLVGVVVGLIARRRGDAAAGDFFPPGELRRQYEQSLAPSLPPPGPIVSSDAYSSPGDVPPPWGATPPGEQPPPEPGRHSRPDAE